MPSMRLTQRRVDALLPRRKVRDIRDAELKGFGVRVMPSGARRYFIHSQHRGKRVWKIIGDAAAIAEPEARARARSMLAALRDGREPASADPGGTLFETVAEEVFDRYVRRWKPRTLDVNRAYLRRQILPSFAGRPIGEITRKDVRAWFRGLHATPAAANRSTPILSVIMQQAEVWGYRPEDSNPCAGIRRYRQGRSERFLTPEEYRRLARVLGRHEASRPPARGRPAPAAADRVPQVGDPDTPMALLPGGAALSTGQQGWPAHGLPLRPDVVLHDHVAAREPVLVPKPLESPVRRVPLLARHIRGPVRLKDRVDDAGEAFSFGRRTGFDRRYPGGAVQMGEHDVRQHQVGITAALHPLHDLIGKNYSHTDRSGLLQEASRRRKSWLGSSA